LEKIQDKVGETEQKIARQCCAKNLWKEVECSKKAGFLPHGDGRVPIACSGDRLARWWIMNDIQFAK